MAAPYRGDLLQRRTISEHRRKQMPRRIRPRTKERQCLLWACDMPRFPVPPLAHFLKRYRKTGQASSPRAGVDS
ncbi:hypothetical protein GCM10027294_22270 [Marinactinospora endophytica]